MADIVDVAAQIEQEHLTVAISKLAAPTPAARGGICDECELDSPALFDGQCAWCHDGRERPEHAQPEPTVTIRKPATSPNKGMGRGYKPAAIATRVDRRQLNVHFPSAKYAEAEAIAAAQGQTISAWARDIVMAVVDGEPQFRRGRKPFIAAEVIRAATDAGQPLDVFVTSLITRGLAAHRQDAR